MDDLCEGGVGDLNEGTNNLRKCKWIENDVI